MKITWKDAVTTLSAGGAVVLSVAYYNDYSWPLVSNVRWVVGGLAVLAAVILVVGFAFDRLSNLNWDLLGITLAVTIGFITAMGLAFAVSGYVVTMLIAILATWLVSISHHFMEQDTPYAHHRFFHA
jgi:hypothetical protein